MTPPRLTLTLTVTSDTPIPAEELGIVIAHAKSEAHVLLERGAVVVKKPNIETPNESRVFFEFSRPKQSAIAGGE